jgi:hypothetical protein
MLLNKSVIKKRPTSLTPALSTTTTVSSEPRSMKPKKTSKGEIDLFPFPIVD